MLKHITQTDSSPNLGVSYPKPPVGQLTKTLRFSTREDAIIYFCCQAPFKYLPQHDFIFTEIARRVPQSQFVFIRADVIEPRLQRALQQLICTVKIMCVPTPSGSC